MHLHDIHLLYEFNYWAKELLLEVLETIPHEQYVKDFGSSHGGIHGTLVHIVGAEDLWLKRWKGESTINFMQAENFPGFESVRDAWMEVEMNMMGFCHMLKTDGDINKTIAYKDLKGNAYSQPLYQLMQHLVNHSTYHRGQITTMIRLLGMKPAGTDMVMFYRQNPSTT
ncbi:MAG: DinB family protein [Ignavibacteriae bacterium]|nr:DinB family protein [Ignavibacteria bacterium]MBI3365834.1 DinB family protein [Ignavibacteriota bacterium]